MTEAQVAAPAVRCAICGGTQAEHEGRQHAFTEKQGDLKTVDQAQREQRERMGQQAQVIRLGGAPTNEANALNRLLEVLMDKGILDMSEALYICGVGTKPQKSGYADPVVAGSSNGGNV